MAEPQAAMDDFLHGGQVSDMTEEINILKKKMRELEGLSVPAAESLLYYAIFMSLLNGEIILLSIS